MSDGLRADSLCTQGRRERTVSGPSRWIDAPGTRSARKTGSERLVKKRGKTPSQSMFWIVCALASRVSHQDTQSQHFPQEWSKMSRKTLKLWKTLRTQGEYRARRVFIRLWPPRTRLGTALNLALANRSNPKGSSNRRLPNLRLPNPPSDRRATPSSVIFYAQSYSFSTAGFSMCT